jgi:hypothetical protein
MANPLEIQKTMHRTEKRIKLIFEKDELLIQKNKIYTIEQQCVYTIVASNRPKPKKGQL